MTDILKTLDAEIAVRESEIAKLMKARAMFAPPAEQAPAAKAAPKRKRRAAGKTREASEQQVQRVRETLTETLHGQASQHRIGQAAGLRSPAVSTAVRQLEAAGVVRRTGEKEGRSPVIELVTAGAEQGAQDGGGQG